MSEPLYLISTHERCGDPCPQIRNHVSDDPDFEYNGDWGPEIRDPEDESLLAEGHEEVIDFLDDHYEDGFEPPDRWE